MAGATPATRLRDEATDEATQDGRRLAKEAGDTHERMVDYFIANVATSGAKQAAGEFIVGFAVEEAEPLYMLCAGELKLAQPPHGANAHLEVVVMDGADKRLVPVLDVHVTLTAQDGSEVGTFHLPFLWHPAVYHYGHSISVPRAGRYTAHVYINTPSFPRHDTTNGKRYTQPVEVEFTGIMIKPGSK